MRKLRLNLELLQVESFTTDASSLRRGTVHGKSGPLTTLTEDVSYCLPCDLEATADATCPVSCGYGVCPQTPNTACEV
jgi:hypothetical protein